MKALYQASQKITRRLLIKLVATGALGASFGTLSTALLTRAGSASPQKARFLSESETRTLEAICERVIPRDDAPGATDLGVVNYIDKNLRGHFAKHQPTYRKGIAAVEATARSLHGSPFTRLLPDRQDSLLESLENGKVSKQLWTETDPEAFFALVVAHTMQGFYGPPRHGGNRDYLSYKMLDLDYPQVIGQNRY